MKRVRASAALTSYTRSPSSFSPAFLTKVQLTQNLTLVSGVQCSDSTGPPITLFSPPKWGHRLSPRNLSHTHGLCSLRCTFHLRDFLILKLEVGTSLSPGFSWVSPLCSPFVQLFVPVNQGIHPGPRPCCVLNLGIILSTLSHLAGEVLTRSIGSGLGPALGAGHTGIIQHKPCSQAAGKLETVRNTGA